MSKQEKMMDSPQFHIKGYGVLLRSDDQWRVDAKQDLKSGNRLSPREAYRFARGEEVVSSTGQAVRLSRPLDWLVIADHSDGMGMVGDIAAGKPQLLAYEQAARWNKGMAEGGDAAVQAALDLIGTFSQGKMDPEMFALYSPGSKIYKNLWERAIADAEEFNDPGRFTAFIGFEWTSLIQGNNMHRVVMMPPPRP